MSTAPPKRTRGQRVSTLKLPPGLFERAWETLHRGDVILRLAMCLFAACLIWTVTGAWNPPFSLRGGMIPQRDIIARVPFEIVDASATRLAREDALSKRECVYRHDPQLLVQLRKALIDKVFELLGAESFDAVDKTLWSAFQPQQTASAATSNDQTNQVAAAVLQIEGQSNDSSPPPAEEAEEKLSDPAADFERFKAFFENDPELKEFGAAIARSMAELDQHGLLKSLDLEVGFGSQAKIQVYSTGNPSFKQTFEVDQVRIGQAGPRLKSQLVTELNSEEVGNQVYSWLEKQLPITLTLDRDLTELEGDELVANLSPVMSKFQAGDSVLAVAGEPIDSSLDLLQTEHTEFVAQISTPQLIAYSLAKFGMYAAFYVVCGFYFYFRSPAILQDIAGLGRLLLLVAVTVCVSWYAAPSRFELIPLMLFAMTVVIVHKQELALLLCSAVALLTVLSRGYGVTELVISLACMSTSVLLIQHIRSRTKLIYVASWTAVATFLTAFGVSLVKGEPIDLHLLNQAAWLAGCCVAAGLLITGLLPFIERFFDVQTDLSLLELGDVAHPLLQELVRRAPGTYNHSINVASIAQAAAESIGANGLLVRVGAYFHDIGKMLKPHYFVENQTGDNKHETLVPAMSTLVIIAHVKDGADLARQHNLPQTIIDFILQHHGTTLVEYFFHRANEQQKEQDPDAEEVDEGSYRYPGPKPQTKEAAVLHLSDAVESAARSLVDPAPSRIESLVEEIAMKRLLDGQFDECQLTLEELRTVQTSIVKSLTAVYHGRIKYPDQQTA